MGTFQEVTLIVQPLIGNVLYEHGKMGRTLVLTIALIMAAIGIAVTGLICLSGIWGIMHGWPVLLVSIPLIVTGIYMFRLWLRAKGSSGVS